MLLYKNKYSVQDILGTIASSIVSSFNIIRDHIRNTEEVVTEGGEYGFTQRTSY